MRIIQALLLISFLIIAASCNPYQEYQSIHADVNEHKDVKYCLGIRKNVEITGYTPNPYGKLHQFLLPVELGGDEKQLQVRIGSRVKVEGRLKGQRYRLERCEPTDFAFGLNVYDHTGGNSSFCHPSKGTYYSRAAVDESLTQIEYTNETVVNCRLSIHRKGWVFSIFFPRGDFEYWPRVERAFLSFVDESFDDLGECKESFLP